MAKHVIQYNIFSGSPLNLASARVQIFLSDGGSPASLYSDYAGLSSLGSHEFAVPTGSFRVYANAGRYDIRAFDESGSFEMWYRDVEVGLAYDNSSYLVTDFGAVADNSTDDSAAFIACQAAAVAAGVKHVIVPYGLYVIDATVSILEGVTWEFRGPTIRTTDSTLTIFSASSVDDWSIIGWLRLQGTAPGSETAQILLSADGCRNYSVNNVVAYRSQGHGFLIGDDAVVDERAEHGTWTACKALECRTGWEFEDGTSAEYTVLNGCSAVSNVTGVKNGAGNTTWSGGTITDNTINISLYGGSNDNHGIFSGVTINHGTTDNVIATDCQNGYTFDGCHFYANGAAPSNGGDITLTNSKQFNFVGGTLACPVVINEGAATKNGTNVFKNMYVNVESWVSFAGDDLGDLICKGLYGDSGLLTGFIYPRGPARVVDNEGFQNSWADFGSGRAPLAYYIDENNWVHINGVITGGTATFGTVVTSLPSGFAPDLLHEFICTQGTSGATAAVQVDAGGDLVWISGSNSQVGINISYPLIG